MANRKSGVLTLNGKSEQRGSRKFSIQSFEMNRLYPLLHEFMNRKKKMGVKEKKLVKILSDEFAHNDITKLLIDYDRYSVLESDNHMSTYVKDNAKSAITILAKYCEVSGIENIEELCSIYSAEEIANKIYGIGVVKLQAFCIYCIVLDVPFYLSEEDKKNGKLYVYKKPPVKRGRKTTTEKGEDK